MTEPVPYTEAELQMLATLRGLHPDDATLHEPPADVWAGITRTLAADSPDVGGPRRPASRRGWWMGAAAVVVAIVAAGTIAVVRGDDDAEMVIAATQLSSDGLDGATPGRQGKAEVIRTSSTELIHVDIGDLRANSGEYLEVWLIKADVSGMVSLGTARSDSTYEIPANLQLADYPIVDVSTEPYDGDPDHSGTSVLRGQFQT